MISFKSYQMLVEDYQTTLKRKGVDSNTINFVVKLSNKDRGKAIAKLMANPRLKIDDLEQVDPQEILAKRFPKAAKDIANADPTNDKSYFDVILWWLNGMVFNTSRKKFEVAREKPTQNIILPEDSARVKEVLGYYNKNKNRFKTKYISRYKSFHELEQEYLDVANKRSKRQQIKDIKTEGADKLYEDGDWVMWGITTPEAACYYGKGTRWCTASKDDDRYAKEYLQRGPLFIFQFKKTDEKYQVDAEFEYFMDEEDNEIQDEEKGYLIGVMAHAFMDNPPKVYRDHLYYAVDLVAYSSDYPGHPDDFTKKMRKYYASKLKTRVLGAASMGASDVLIKWSPYFSWNELSEFEDLAALHFTGFSNVYRTLDGDVSDRFKKMTWENIKKSKEPTYLSSYMKLVGMEERNKEVEELLLDPKKFRDTSYQQAAYHYAAQIIGGRWKEAEPMIKRNLPLYQHYIDLVKKEDGIDLEKEGHLEYLLSLPNNSGFDEALSFDFEKNTVPTQEVIDRINEVDENTISQNIGLIMRYVEAFGVEVDSIYKYLTKDGYMRNSTHGKYLFTYQRILGNKPDKKIQDILIKSPEYGRKFMDEFLNGNVSFWVKNMINQTIPSHSSIDFWGRVISNLELHSRLKSKQYSEMEIAPATQALEKNAEPILQNKSWERQNFIPFVAQYAVNIRNKRWESDVIHQAIIDFEDRTMGRYGDKYKELFGSE